MAQPAVVDSNPLSARVAAMIGARLVPGHELVGEHTPVVMVASTQAEVDAAAHAARGSRPPAAVIAWRLPESVLVRLLELPVPCLVGEPEPERLRAVLDGSGDGIERAAERSAAGRYAVLESWLAQTAKPLPEAGLRRRNGNGGNGRNGNGTDGHDTSPQ